MSEIAPGSVSLEDDNSASFDQPTPPPAPETPPETPPVQAQEQDTEPEGTIVNPNGEKLVPLSALAAKRQEASTAKAALAEKEALIASLQEKAQKYDQVAGEWQAVQPLIQQLRNAPQQAPPPQVKPKGPLTEQEAIDYARDLDLYKTDNNGQSVLDVDRAQRLAARADALAERKAQQMVQPLYQHSAQQQSALLREKVAAQPAPNGIVVDRAILDQIWSMVPPEMSQRPEVAAMLWRQALADTVLSGKYKAPVSAPPPPVQTESLGGTAPVRELSQIDRNMMQAASLKPAEYEKVSANFKPGQSNSLE